jgi:hypothetical protein
MADELLGNPKVQADRFGVANVQIAVRLRREAVTISAWRPAATSAAMISRMKSLRAGVGGICALTRPR